ncbi:MAG: methyltransferase domain-containing protein [Pseudomonadales bacterium]
MSATEDVQKYYGETLSSNQDLKTSACCPADALPAYLKPIVSRVHPEVREKFYGCGSPLPPHLAGQSVLDLGCGTGRDCYVVSRLVGETGHVTGVDMTKEQLEIANKHVDYHRELWGYQASNVTFQHGYIEDLAAIGIADNSLDIVISNCVINLSEDKTRVFKEIFRVLKPGGELYFSDIFARQRIPAELTRDPVLRGECLGGAMYLEDFRRALSKMGIHDYRVLASSPLTIEDPTLARLVANIDFLSLTIRVFKLPLEDRCEDYGQVAWYLGGIDECPNEFMLDDHHRFVRNKPMLICSNTARMLGQSRYAPFFRIDGDERHHFGLFDCSGPDCRSPERESQPGCC